MAIVNNLVGTTATELYASSGNTALVVAYLCNTGASGVTVQIHAVPNGESVSDQNKLYHDLVIPAGDTFIIDTEKLIFSDGDKLFATASSPNVLMNTISYVGI